jgi:tRNA G18 (ribose-2'-O)-methylase SpoU
MPVIPIHDFQDPRLEPYRHLKDNSYPLWESEFVAEAGKLVTRLLDARWPLSSVLLADKRLCEWEELIPTEVPVYVLPSKEVEKVLGFNFHRGILAIAPRPRGRSLEERLPDASLPAMIVVMVDVHDPENVGSILRASAAFGAIGVILSHRCADPFSRRVFRVSMGTGLRIWTHVSHDMIETIRLLKRRNFETMAAVLSDRAEPLTEVVGVNRMALVLGNEGDGLPANVVNECDRHLSIPMARGVDSLNVSMAAGIFLHHLTR